MAPSLRRTFLLCTLATAALSLGIPMETRVQNILPVEWVPCANVGVNNDLRLQCANFTAPIDWDAPDNDYFNIGIVKLPTNGTERIGNLFVNPGGPGGSATSMVADIAAGKNVVASQVRERFDIIGIDPRGIGLSNAIRCDPDIWNERVSLFPTDEILFQKMVDWNQRLGQSCRELSGPLLEHVDTISVVRDLEAVRIALGNEPITWLGFSYGTQISAQYAAQFPNNIRAILNDGVVQHSQDESAVFLTESTTYENVLEHFLTWASNDTASPLQGQDVKALWTSLIDGANLKPIAAIGCNDQCRSDVSGEEILFSAQGLLISKSVHWPVFAQALFEASNGNATLLSMEGTWAAPQDPGPFARQAVGCLDWYHNATTLADVLAKQNLGRTFAPLIRGATQTYSYQAGCIGWPAKVVNPPKPEHVNISAPILMVNAFSDPESSYTWALGMKNEIRNATLLSRNGDGHTSYFLGGETTTAMNDFLVNLTLPEDGTVLNS